MGKFGKIQFHTAIFIVMLLIMNIYAPTVPPVTPVPPTPAPPVTPGDTSCSELHFMDQIQAFGDRKFGPRNPPSFVDLQVCKWLQQPPASGMFSQPAPPAHCCTRETLTRIENWWKNDKTMNSLGALSGRNVDWVAYIDSVAELYDDILVNYKIQILSHIQKLNLRVIDEEKLLKGVETLNEPLKSIKTWIQIVVPKYEKMMLLDENDIGNQYSKKKSDKMDTIFEDYDGPLHIRYKQGKKCFDLTKKIVSGSLCSMCHLDFFSRFENTENGWRVSFLSEEAQKFAKKCKDYMVSQLDIFYLIENIGNLMLYTETGKKTTDRDPWEIIQNLES